MAANGGKLEDDGLECVMAGEISRREDAESYDTDSTSFKSLSVTFDSANQQLARRPKTKAS